MPLFHPTGDRFLPMPLDAIREEITGATVEETLCNSTAASLEEI